MPSEESPLRIQQAIRMVPGFVNCVSMAAAFLIAQEIGFSEVEAAIVVSFVFGAQIIHGLTYVAVDYAEEWAEPSDLVSEQ